MSNILNIHINTFYSWLKNKGQKNFKSNNLNDEIEKLIIDIYNKGCKKIKNIKKKIKNCKNVNLTYKEVIYVLNKNKLLKNKNLKNEIDNLILDEINKKKTLTGIELKSIIKNKLNIERSKTYIYKVLKNNNITFKKTKLMVNAYSIDKQKEQVNVVHNEIKKYDIKNIVSLDEMSVRTLKIEDMDGL